MLFFLPKVRLNWCPLKLLLAGVVWLWAGPLQAQTDQTCPVVQLDSGLDAQIALGASACAFLDESQDKTLSDILADTPDIQFQPIAGDLIDYGFSASRIWIKVRLQNASDETGTWWVTHDIPVANSLHVNLVSQIDNSTRQLLSLTDQDTFLDRPIAHRHLVSEVALRPGEAATLIIDYTSGQATEMPLFAETVPVFFKRVQAENLEIIALAAMVLGMGVISTIYLFGLAGKTAFAYGFYVLSSGALLAHMDGLSFQYIWPQWPGLNQVALPVIGTVFVALGINFVSRFTQTKKHQPRLNKAAYALIILLFGIAVCAPFLIAEVWFKQVLLLTALVGLGMQIALAVTAALRRESGAGFLLIGFGALAASSTFAVVGYLTEGLFQQELAGTAMRLAFLIEAAAFSAAIAMRVIATRKERDASLREQLRLTKDRLNLSEALRRAEDDRQNATRRARQSQEALESTAHDIRQPLAALQMALSSGTAEPDRLLSNLNYLEGILRGGLDTHAAPLGTGDVDPPSGGAPERIQAKVVLKNIQTMFSAEAFKKNVRLSVLECSDYLMADPLALMRIVGNLVSNSLQHGRATRVVVGCRKVNGGLRFEVHDNGTGISQRDLRRIFQRGQKGITSTGKGIGLSIISALAAEHGMEFNIASKPGHGTVARITVPAYVSPQSKGPVGVN